MMTKRTLSLLTVSMLVLWIGCAGSNKATDETAKAKASDAAVQVTSAEVYVEGKYRATTPTTLRLRRGFGEAEVTLKRGNNVVRQFAVLRVNSSNGTDLVFGYQGRSQNGMPTFDLTSLSQQKDGTYVIPYFAQPILIEDREYGLSLIVEE
ncbi:MAG TPA: hypothetical protein VFG50_04920 [Rhodothermales bacterium]|nr:hypothetical protein [Rhodothermales bacterium]